MRKFRLSRDCISDAAWLISVALERAALASPEAQEFWRRTLAGAAPARLPDALPCWPITHGR